MLAALQSGDANHAAVIEALRVEGENATRLLLPALVLGELDYLLRREGHRDALGPVLEDVAQGVYRLECPTPGDMRRARTIVERYRVDLTDATVAALAERNGRRILTADRRDFERLRTQTGKPFTLLP